MKPEETGDIDLQKLADELLEIERLKPKPLWDGPPIIPPLDASEPVKRKRGRPRKAGR